ncbi:TetR/AcrR family transcriptional regulator [Streptomyces sp. NPDC051636]|uniref:TetR/AcrR family transcriptional regulator n=1 Tax=Streptomyces sp. NPDC051636 TaxID=3365663 RepID=UPI00378D9455
MRDDQREASRRRLIDAALGILAEEGFRGLTVKKVGDRAGVSRGMVNYHFESKAGLVEAVINDIREVFVDRLRALPGYHRMTGLEAVLAKLEQYFSRLAEPGPSVRARALLVLLVEAVGSQGDTAKGSLGGQLDLVRTGLEDDIRRGAADGSVRPDWTPARRHSFWRAWRAAYCSSTSWNPRAHAWRRSAARPTTWCCWHSLRTGGPADAGGRS